MSIRKIIIIILLNAILASVLFLLLLHLPATVSIEYTSGADVTLKTASTKQFGNSRDSKSFPVSFKKTEKAEIVSFNVPISELRFLYLDVVPSTSLEIVSHQYTACGILNKIHSKLDLRRNFQTDNHVNALYHPQKELLLIEGADQTGELRLNLANDLPRLLPWVLAISFFVLFTGLQIWLYYKISKKDLDVNRIACTLSIAFFLILIFVIPAMEPMFLEKPKQPAPKFEIAHITGFPDEFNYWYRYNLPFRRTVFDFYHAATKKIGVDPVKDVIIGEDSFLFSRREARYLRERPYDDYLGINLYSEWHKKRILNNLLYMQNALKKRGIRFVVYFAPNKVMVYPEKLPKKYRRKDPDGKTKTKDLVEYLRAHSTIPVIYPLNEMREAAASVPVPIYFCHDTHWNGLGAYVGTKELLKTVAPDYAAKMPALSSMKLVLDKPHRGDLANMMQAPVELVEKEIYTLNDWKTPVGADDAYGYYLLPPVKNNGPRCFLIRDSFTANMIPYLNHYFSQCAFYWSYKLNLELIDSFKPDIVILESVERLSDRLLYIEETNEKLGRIEIN